MQPVTVAINARDNATYSDEWAFLDDDGTPIAVGGFTFSLQVRSYGGASGAALIALGAVADGPGETDGIVAYTDVAGTLRITIKDETLRTLPTDGAEPGEAVRFDYDLRAVDAAGFSEIWAQGPFYLTRGVTR